jgi:peptidoglycan hydrolase CwlO-like protein
MLETFLYPVIASFLTALGMKILEWRKGKADTKSTEIDNEIKSATFYQTLLDDMSKRLNDAIIAIEKRDERIKERDTKIEELIDHIENLTGELRKYKQLNGKTE